MESVAHAVQSQFLCFHPLWSRSSVRTESRCSWRFRESWRRVVRHNLCAQHIRSARLEASYRGLGGVWNYRSQTKMMSTHQMTTDRATATSTPRAGASRLSVFGVSLYVGERSDDAWGRWVEPKTFFPNAMRVRRCMQPGLALPYDCTEIVPCFRL